MSDYDRVASAIAFIEQRLTDQPGLDEIAAHVHLSPFHFQRLFSRWAGTTPKRFLQVLTLERGKHLLEQSRPLLEVSDALGLSSSSRLHDHFVQIEAVTPGEYKSRGRDLQIRHGLHETPFGHLFVAMTGRGVCQAVFIEDEDADAPLQELQQAWPLAQLVRDQAATQVVVEAMLGTLPDSARPLPLHVSGTNFQLAVWRALLRIPAGSVSSYSQLAAVMGCPQAARAVGNAIGANPVAVLIPCHRVIQQSGALGGYRWGSVRKQTIQVWERTRLESLQGN